MYGLAVVVHALAGTTALVLAVVALERTTRVLPALPIALVVMVGALGAAIGSQWLELPVSTRLLFLALCGLGVVVVLRGTRAWMLARRASGVPTARRQAGIYGHSLAFTIIALTDAFFIVLVLDLGGPAWAMVSVGVGIAVVGHLALRARLRVLQPRWTS